MSEFHSGRHRGACPKSTTNRMGSALAIAALGVGTSAFAATSASAAPTTPAAPAAPAVPTTPAVKSAPTLPAAPATYSGYVRYGDRGSEVRAVQRVVGVNVDGVFGPKTLAGVKRYQRSHNLAVDGIVGPKTGTKMGLGGSGGSSAGSTGGSTSKTNFTGYIRYGDRGSDVRQVQRVVGVSADGVFGPNTLSAVKRWQRSHGLTADGIVGPKTGSAMGISSSGGSTGGSTGGGGGSSDPGYSASSVLSTAASLVGTPYTWGGTSPSTGFDCSGYIQYVFAQHGISLPRTAAAQQDATTRVSNPRPGDLVFFGNPAYHDGIYAGNGMMYDAGNSRVDTTKRAIWTSDVTYHRVR